MSRIMDTFNNDLDLYEIARIQNRNTILQRSQMFEAKINKIKLINYKDEIFKEIVISEELLDISKAYDVKDCLTTNTKVNSPLFLPLLRNSIWKLRCLKQLGVYGLNRYKFKQKLSIYDKELPQGILLYGGDKGMMYKGVPFCFKIDEYLAIGTIKKMVDCDVDLLEWLTEFQSTVKNNGISKIEYDKYSISDTNNSSYNNW